MCAPAETYKILNVEFYGCMMTRTYEQRECGTEIRVGGNERQINKLWRKNILNNVNTHKDNENKEIKRYIFWFVLRAFRVYERRWDRFGMFARVCVRKDQVHTHKQQETKKKPTQADTEQYLRIYFIFVYLECVHVCCPTETYSSLNRTMITVRGMNHHFSIIA